MVRSVTVVKIGCGPGINTFNETESTQPVTERTTNQMVCAPMAL